MSLGVAEGRWSLEGWAVRALSRLILVIGLALAGAIVVGPVWWVYTRVMAGRETDAVALRWAEIGRSLEALVEQYPPRVANASAVRLEELARPLGVDLVPKPVGERTRPDEDLIEESEAVAGTLNTFAQTVGTSDRLVTEPLAGEVAAYLERHRDSLTAVVQHLLREEPPLWECDVTGGLEAPLPNLLGQIRLTRMLVAWSILLGRSERPEEAERAIEAAWALHLAAARRPEYLSQLVAAAEANMIAGAVRNHPAPPAAWTDLLLSFDAMDAVLDAVQFDGWASLQVLRHGDLFGADTVFAWTFLPALQRGLAANADALRTAVITLPETRFAEFDPGESFAVTLESAMPESITARIALMDVWQGWAQVGRSMLCRELTAEVVRLRNAGRSTDGGGQLELPRHQVSVVFPSVAWRFDHGETGVLIEPAQALPAVPPKGARSLCTVWFEEVPRGR